MQRTLAGLALLVATTATGDAFACGGCFHEQNTLSSSADSIVTGHRMAFTLAPDRTVLWDQIKFTGSPSEFGWVLPVQHGAFLEASSDAWFEALETFSKVTVTGPTLQCAVPAPSSGIGCGASSKSDAVATESGGSYYDNNPVTVVHQGTVGPYETVTLQSADGSALRDWLTNHGYVVEPEIDPIIDAYVGEGADFIALRLIPGKGVDAMTPVRVVTPGGPSMLPLRMVAAGTGRYVDIVLYVIGEGRYQLDDFHEVFVDGSQLSFDFVKNDSNYSLLRQNALGENAGYSFLTAFATSSPFSGQELYQGPPTFQAGGPGASFLDATYFAQAQVDGPSTADGGPSLCQLGDLHSQALVGIGTGAAINAADFSCNGYSDLAAALIGLHPDKTWITRLEMNLPHEALGADCKLSLSKDQKEQSNQLTAVKVSARPSTCPEPIFQSSLGPPQGSPRTTFAWGVAAFAALSLLRRGRKSRR